MNKFKNLIIFFKDTSISPIKFEKVDKAFISDAGIQIEFEDEEDNETLVYNFPFTSILYYTYIEEREGN